MIGKLLLFLAVLAVGAHAAPDYYIVVSSDDQVKILDHIIDAINYFFDINAAINEGALTYKSLLKFVVLLGVLYATVRLAVSAMTGSAGAGFKHYVIYLFSIVFVLIIIYGPKSTVLIQTQDGTAYASQREVPQLFAFSLSLFTTLKKTLNDLSEVAFDIPDPTDNYSSGGAAGLGYVGMQTTLARAFEIATFFREADVELKSMYPAYLRDCVILPAITTSGITTVEKMLHSSSLKSKISPSETGFGDSLITWNNGVASCSDFWDGGPEAQTQFGSDFKGLNAEIYRFETNSTTQSENYRKLGSALAYSGAVIEDSNAIANASAVQESITQAVLSNEFKTTFSAMGIAGEVMADGAAQANADVQLNGISTGMYMSTMLPTVSFIAFALMVAVTPFTIAFALLPGALSVLINFLRTLLWVSLWEPMANIVGIFLDYYFAELLQQNGFNTVNGVLAIDPSNFINIGSEAATIAGIAGGLYVAVQGLSWMLLTGSGQMLGNLMNGMATSFQNRANAAAQLATQNDLKETDLLSEEMGRIISQREKYAYQTNTQAATSAAEISGRMHAFGRSGASPFSSMTHSGSVSNALNHGTGIGMTNEIGTGANAAKIGYKTGTGQGAQTVEHMSGHTTESMRDLGKTKGAQQWGSDHGTTDEYRNNNGVIDTGMAGSTAYTMTKYAEKGAKANAASVGKMSNGEQNMMTEFNAKMQHEAPINALKVGAAAHGTSTQNWADQVVTDKTTMDASSQTNARQQIQEHGGRRSFIRDSQTLTKDRSNLDKHNAHRIQSELRANPGAVDAKNEQQSEITTGQMFERAKHRARVLENNHRLKGERRALFREFDAVQKELGEFSKKIVDGEPSDILNKEEMARREELIQQEAKMEIQLDSYNEAIALSDKAVAGVTNQDVTLGTSANNTVAAQSGVLNADIDATRHAYERGGMNQSREAALLEKIATMGVDHNRHGIYTGTKEAMQAVGDQKAQELQSQTKFRQIMQTLQPENRQRAMEIMEDFGYIEGGDPAVNAVAMDSFSNAMEMTVRADGATRRVTLDTDFNAETVKVDSQDSVSMGHKVDTGQAATAAIAEGVEAYSGQKVGDYNRDQLKVLAVGGDAGTIVGKFGSGLVTKAATKKVTKFFDKPPGRTAPSQSSRKSVEEHIDEAFDWPSQKSSPGQRDLN